MGRLTVDGLDGVIDDLSELAKLPDSVITDILNAEADIIVRAQRTEIESRWKGLHSLGLSTKSIKKGKVKKGPNGWYITKLMRRKKALCKGYFYPLVKVALSDDTTQTKTDSITFGTNNTTFTVSACEAGDA